MLLDKLFGPDDDYQMFLFHMRLQAANYFVSTFYMSILLMIELKSKQYSHQNIKINSTPKSAIELSFILLSHVSGFSKTMKIESKHNFVKTKRRQK